MEVKKLHNSNGIRTWVARTGIFCKISKNKIYKIAPCLLCANLCQCDAIDFGSPILCGRIVYGVVDVQRWAHSLFEP